MNDEDIRHDDLEFEPSLEPKSSRAWINLLEESEKAFEDWNDHCDRIDKQYGTLERLSERNARPRVCHVLGQLEVIKPSIYAKPPTPVVTAKFKDRRPVYQQAAELMERCCVVAFDLAHINDLMLQIRDDVAIAGRGVAWCRYESGKKNGSKGYGGQYDHEKVCIDFKHRRDFLHSIIALLVRGDVGGGGIVSDARRGAQAVQAVFRRRLPGGRVLRRQGQPGGGRRRRQGARQVLGDLAQAVTPCAVGGEGVRGHSGRGRSAPRPAELLPVPQARLWLHPARLS